MRKFCSLLCLMGMISSLAVAHALTLAQTGVGRFGAGRQITANTASQNLLTWNVVNTGRDVEVRLYDPDGNPLRLGRCGLPAANAEVHNVIRDIGWTQLTSRYTTANAALDVDESLLTPVLWFRANSPELALFQAEKDAEVQTLALPLRDGITSCDPRRGYEAARQGRLARPWFLALVRQGDYRFPVVCLLPHTPEAIQTLPSGGIVVRWKAGRSAETLGLLPLFGCRPAALNLTAGWERRLPDSAEKRIDTLAAWFIHRPTGLQETYRLTADAVQIADTLRFAADADDWGWSRRMRGYALVPPALVNARRYGYPVRFRRPTTTFAYPLFLSPLCAVRDARILAYSLPLPSLYRTITSPYVDPVLKTVLPDAVRKTIRDYSAYVVQTYRAKPGVDDENSAIGEARSMASEYPCSRLMNPTARKTFTRWADQAARRLYDRQACYGYGKEAANGRKFLLDNYRIGGKDFIDAGWFGYDIMAMWARAHYAGRWNEVRQNWLLIKELFYGWNWTYSDYAVMAAPLYVDAEKGGNPKGYTDNMAMLPAAYAWARMADHLGDRKTLRDALYMLARERVARFNRMSIYAYTRSCGFHTDVNYLPSDMWDGPNIAPSGRYIPSEAMRKQTGAIVNYGGDAAGLWYLSGSFLEPVSPETIDMMLTGDMKRHVADSVQTMDRRFPRWWASPGAGEPANYQIYLRGVLFHADPQFLRYVFDYQDGFRQGVWYADAWHADAFAGIILSGFHGLEYRDAIDVRYRDGNGWRPVKANVEWNLLIDPAGRCRLTLWNTTPAPLAVQVRFHRRDFGGIDVRDLKRGRRLRVARDGLLRVTLTPGSNVFALPFLPAAPRGSDVRLSTPKVLPLPAVTALLDVEGSKVVRMPEIGIVHVVARNRLTHPITLHLHGSLNGRSIAEKPLSLAADTGAEWNLPLRTEAVSPGRYTLTVAVEGAGSERQEQTVNLLLLARKGAPSASQPLLLYGFEQDTDGWTMPDWPDANKDEKGRVFQPAVSNERAREGRQSLKATFNIAPGKESKGFIGVHPASDWTPFRRVLVDVYLPADAPEGLEAHFYMMGDGWRWHEAVRGTALRPGQWTTVEAALIGPESGADWGIAEKEVRAGLANVLDFGLRVNNTEPNRVGYHGPVYLDNFRVGTD